MISRTIEGKYLAPQTLDYLDITVFDRPEIVSIYQKPLMATNYPILETIGMQSIDFGFLEKIRLIGGTCYRF